MGFSNEKIEDCKINGIEYEPDSCPKAWKHYKIVYSNKLKDYDLDDAKLSFYNYWKNVDGLKSGCKDGKDWFNYVDKPIRNINRIFLLNNNTKIKVMNDITYIDICTSRLIQ